MQRYLEPYQDAALESWFPQALQQPSSNFSLAIQKFAFLWKQQHDDSWWADFLAGTRKEDLAAVKALNAASLANVNDLSQEAIHHAREAAQLFVARHNLAGELRARFEEVYALQRGLSSGDCRSRANELSQRLAGTTYHWLQAQAALEKATCANWASDFKTVAANLKISSDLLAKFKFPELALRKMALDASINRQQARYVESWNEAVGGLHLYWQGFYSPERLYQFYAVMRQCARAVQLHNAAEALLLHAIQIREQNFPGDLSLKATLYLRLANELRRQDENALADAKVAQAMLLVKQISPKEPNARRYVLTTQIEAAELELQRGKPALALSEINSIRELLDMQADFVNLDFYKVLGNILLQLKQFDAASASYESAIDVAERSDRAISDDSGRLQWLMAAEETYRGLTQSLLAKGDDEKALAAWELFKSRSLKAPGPSGQPRGIRDDLSRTVVSSSQTHLVYATFKDNVQVWLVKGSAVKGRLLPVKPADLQRLIKEFAENCANPHSLPDTVKSQAETLYSLLLSPVMSDLSAGETVAIELDEALGTLTMEALRSGDGTYFGDLYPVIYSPGLLVEATLRIPVPPTPQDPFLLVDTSSSRGSGHLPGHDIEEAAITRDFPQRTLITPSSTTTANIREALRNSVGFDFIGHGKADGTGTALVLTSSLSLKATDFSPEILPKMRFAVLSACSSGTAQNGLLDTGNLVRSFLAARVPTIIASHWNVDSMSTAQFMKAFYLHMGEGESAPVALRDARKEMRSVKNHPYYWAGFSLNGRAS
jgi:CHAT domain-containing protein